METRSGFGCGRGNEGHHVGLWPPGPGVTSKAAPRAVSGWANGVNAGDREGRQRGAVPPVWPLWDHVKEPRRVVHLPTRADEPRIGVSPATPQPPSAGSRVDPWISGFVPLRTPDHGAQHFVSSSERQEGWSSCGFLCALPGRTTRSFSTERTLERCANSNLLFF